MNDEQLLRYSRHILLDEIGIEGQERLLASHALIIGAGGLGSPAALFLGASGIGQITLVDDDEVDMTNLQRQIAHTTARTGAPKVESMREALHAINPGIKINCLTQRADDKLLHQLVPTASVVLDCTDNYRTRQLINAACIQHSTPLIEGAAIRFDGQLMVIDPRNELNACYACIFPPEAEFEEVQCSTMGVFAPMVGIIGSMQAAEAMKIIIGMNPATQGKLMMLDGLTMQWSEMRVRRSPTCSVCGSRHVKK